MGFQPIDYMKLSQDLSAQLNEMRAKIPFLADSRPASSLTKLANARVTDEFVNHLADVVSNSAVLTTRVPGDVATMLDLRGFAAAFALFESQLRAFSESMHMAVALARNDSGTAALNVYDTAKSLQRHPGNEQLVPHIRDLRRILGRAGIRHKAKAKTPAPSPVPVPTPVPTT